MNQPPTTALPIRSNDDPHTAALDTLLQLSAMAPGTGRRLLQLVEASFLSSNAGARIPATDDLARALDASRRVFGPSLPSAATVMKVSTIGGPPDHLVRASELRPAEPQVQAPDILILPDVFLGPGAVVVERRTQGGLRLTLPRATIPGSKDGAIAALWLEDKSHRRLVRDRLASRLWRRQDESAFRPINFAPSVFGAPSAAEWTFLRDLLPVPASALWSPGKSVAEPIILEIDDWPYDETPRLTSNAALVGISGALRCRTQRTVTTAPDGRHIAKLERVTGVALRPEAVFRDHDVPILHVDAPGRGDDGSRWAFNPVRQEIIFSGRAPGPGEKVWIELRYDPPEPGPIAPTARYLTGNLRFDPLEELRELRVDDTKPALSLDGWPVAAGSELSTRADVAAAIADYAPFAGVLEPRIDDLAMRFTAFYAHGALEMGLTLELPFAGKPLKADQTGAEALIAAVLRSALSVDMPLRVVLRHES